MNKIENYLLKNFDKVKINTKNINDGDVFIALQGNNNHGINFAKEAITKGVKYIITDQKFSDNNFDKVIYLVNDTLNYLSNIARQKRNLYDGVVIGITGSIGKTSVKETLNFFLSHCCRVSASIKSYNNYLGVILSILNLDLNSKFAIFELGTNNFFEIRNLTSLVKPSQIIITNIHPTHLEKLISTKYIAKEKSDIFNFKYNPLVELAILSTNNMDESYLVEKAKNYNISKIMTFGNGDNSNIKNLEIVNIDNFYSSIKFNFENRKIIFKINNDHLDKLDNIIISFLIFIYNDLNLNIFFNLTKDVPLLEGRGLKKNIIFNGKKINFIDESYNASPQSMKNCINYFNKLKINFDQKKFLILGDMKELGKNEIIFHEELISFILEKNFENVIICGKLLKLGLQKNKNKNILCMNDLETILYYLKNELNKNDLILIKGSNSSLSNKLAKILLKRKVT